MRDDAVLRRALPLGRGLGRCGSADIGHKIQHSSREILEVLLYYVHAVINSLAFQ